MFKSMRIFLLFCALIASGQVAAELIDGEELADPTRPLNFAISVDTEEALEIFRTVVPASYAVSFIRTGSSSSVAVINGQSVTIGDLIGGAKVVAIDRSGVTLLTNDNEEKRIGLSSTNIKPALTTH